MGNAGIYELDPGSGLVVSETGGTPSANVRLSPTRIRLFGKP
jgi:hypothetical protein